MEKDSLDKIKKAKENFKSKMIPEVN